MEKYLRTVSNMYSQFKQRKAHPMEKYIGRLVSFSGEEVEVVGYCADMSSLAKLIIDASQVGGWDQSALEPFDVVFKECEKYWYVYTDNLIN